MYSNEFINAFRVDHPCPKTPWLDCDAAGLKSRYSKRQKLDAVVRDAIKHLDTVPEGQIGIYQSYFGGKLYGYVIKYAGQSPYFEPAKDDEHA